MAIVVPSLPAPMIVNDGLLFGINLTGTWLVSGLLYRSLPV
jgi:hypothetical protein